MKNRKGFTLLEVSLFLALSGLLIVSVIVGTNRNIARQRYNNSIDSIADSFRGIYSQVTYTQNSIELEAGRHNKAIYGKLITIGEDEESPSRIYIYTIVGNVLSSRDIGDLGNISPIEALYWVNANVFLTEVSVEGSEVFIVNESSLNPDWGAEIEDSDGNSLKKSLLIIRSPLSGDIFTYVSNEVLPVHERLSEGNTDNFLKNYLPVFTNRPEEDYAANQDQDLRSRVFEAKDLDFCINSEDIWAAGNFRRNIRILKNGHNSTAVEVVLDDAEGNKCLEQ